MNALIIGYGSIGRRHLNILSGFSEISNVKLVSKQTHPDFESYISLEKIPLQVLSGFDYFVIASETFLHASQLGWINDHVSGKNILVEKPMFSSLAEAPNIAAGKNKIYVAYNLRFHPVLKKIKNVLAGEKVLSARITVGQYLPTWRPDRDYRKTYSANSKKGGGVLLDLSHEIDYMQWLFGRIEEISAINCKISGLEIESDDYLSAIGITEKKCLFNLSMDYLNYNPTRLISIQTDSCTIDANLITGDFAVFRNNTKEAEKIEVGNTNQTYSDMHKSVLFNPDEFLCDFRQGYDVMHSIEKIRSNNILKGSFNA